MAMVPDRDGVDIRMSLTHVIRTSIPHAHTHRDTDTGRQGHRTVQTSHSLSGWSSAANLELK